MTTYNLAAGKTWVTGESVTAPKLNTSQTGSSITITDNLIGASSSTDNNIPQWDGTTGALLKDGKIFTTDVDSGSLDTEVPSAKACYDALPTATSASDAINIGTKRMQWKTGTNVTTPTSGNNETQTITISGFSSIDQVMVSTLNASGTATATSWFQVRTWTTTSVEVYCITTSSNAATMTPHILAIGTAS